MGATLIIGDVHLGKGLSIGKPGSGGTFNSRIVDQIKLLDWIFEQATERDVDTIIFSGDIFEDLKPDYRIVDLFIKFLKKCESSNVDTHIILGNHDIKRYGKNYYSSLDLITSADMPRTHIYKNISTIFKDNIGITLLPFRDRASLECSTFEEALDILRGQLVYESAYIPDDYIKVLVGHIALEGSLFVGDEVDSMFNELVCPLNMFSDYNYVWMGHVHKPQVISKSPHIAHIGSLDISNFGETNQEKIIILLKNNKEPFEELVVPTRQLRRVSIEVTDVVKDITNYIIECIDNYNKINSLKNAIVRIEIRYCKDSETANRKVIEKHLYNCGAYYVANFLEMQNINVVPIEKKDYINNIMSPKESVKLYADKQKFKCDEYKNDYIQISNDIIDRCGS